MEWELLESSGDTSSSSEKYLAANGGKVWLHKYRLCSGCSHRVITLSRVFGKARSFEEDNSSRVPKISRPFPRLTISHHIASSIVTEHINARGLACGSKVSGDSEFLKAVELWVKFWWFTPGIDKFPRMYLLVVSSGSLFCPKKLSARFGSTLQYCVTVYTHKTTRAICLHLYSVPKPLLPLFFGLILHADWSMWNGDRFITQTEDVNWLYAEKWLCVD